MRAVAVLGLFSFLAMAGDPPKKTDYFIYDYGKECAEEIGVEVPPLDCNSDKFTTLKIFQDGKEVDGEVFKDCDNPSHLQANKACAPGARLAKITQKIRRNGVEERITTMVLCRRSKYYPPGSNVWNDIGVIQYNETRNKACWFYMLSDDGLASDAVVPPFQKGRERDGADDKRARAYWRDPEIAAGGRCDKCHDAGPWVRSPYVQQAADDKRPEIDNAVPGNMNRSPVHSVGKLHQQWNKTPAELIRINTRAFLATLGEEERKKVYTSLREGSLASPGKCTQCHALGRVRDKKDEKWPSGSGTCGDFALSATGRGGKVNESKLSSFGKTFPASHWMPPQSDWPHEFSPGETGKEQWEAYYKYSVLAMESCCKDPDWKVKIDGKDVFICRPEMSPIQQKYVERPAH